MTETTTRAGTGLPKLDVPAWPPHLERRRPGRNPDVRPELIPLLRDPGQQGRLLLDQFDAAGPGKARRQTDGHVVGLVAAVMSCVIGWSVAVLLMVLLWG